jgi:precorrin-2 dehydrogenase/sirohydrochlorin ferrochelatase
MASIPLLIDLKEKKVVVVGGGKVAQRRISTLIETGCSIIVISPEITATIETFYKQKLLQWHKKNFSPNDLIGAFMVIVATNNSSVNKQVIASAPSYSLINAVESVTNGDVQFPIHLKRGKLSISISTNGASPILAKQIKKKLEGEYDERYEDYLDFLSNARQLVKQSSMTGQQKRTILKQIVMDDLLDIHKQQQLLAWIKQQI